MLLGAKSSILAGTLAAIGASVCCVGPLVLLMLGVGGAWISHLTAFEPFRSYFIGLTLFFLILAFPSSPVWAFALNLVRAEPLS